MSEEVAEDLSGLMEQRSKELGRELRPDDKLFDGIQLEHAEHEMVQAMQASGVDPAIIYAFTETGLLVSEENQHLITEKDMADWQAAIEKYRAENLDPGGDDLPPEAVEGFFKTLSELHPEAMEEMKSLAEQFDAPDEFANAVLIGPCPKCASDSTEDCECDPEIDDPCIARCKDCRQLFCCDCRCLFKNAKEAVRHDCPEWERMAREDDDEPF